MLPVPSTLPFLLQLFCGGKLEHLILSLLKTYKRDYSSKASVLTGGAVSLINLNPGSKPSVKPCYIPAIWTNLKVKAANPTRQLPLDKTLPLCNKIRGRA